LVPLIQGGCVVIEREALLFGPGRGVVAAHEDGGRALTM
jgi:hypothetical protein